MPSDSERKATTQHKAQVIQLLPTPEQRDYFMRAAGTARYAYNWGLALWNIQYKIHKATGTAQRPNPTLVWKAWNKFKKDNVPWAYEISSNVPKWAIYDALPSAFKNWWNKSTPAGPPKFKSRRTARKSFVAHDKCKPEHFERRRLKFQKIGWVRCRESLRWQKLKVSRVTVSESAGKWYATVLFEDPNFTPPVHENQEAVVGVDLGSRKLAVAYNGDGYAHFDNPKALEAAQKNLRRWQRKAARRGERDKNGRVIRVTSGLRRANDRIAKLHKRIADIRRWHQHNLSNSLTRDYGIVGTEDLHVKGMMGGRSARALADAGMGEILRQIGYKSEWCGGVHNQVGQFYPSSRLCSECSYNNDEIGSRERWACPNCGVIHDRDENAAKNIYRETVEVGGSTLEPAA